jgi:hypothetical protein
MVAELNPNMFRTLYRNRFKKIYIFFMVVLIK